MELHDDGPEVGLAGHGAQGRVFGEGHADDVGTVRETVGEDFQKADARAAFRLRQTPGAERLEVGGLIPAGGHGHEKLLDDPGAAR